MIQMSEEARQEEMYRFDHEQRLEWDPCPFCGTTDFEVTPHQVWDSCRKNTQMNPAISVRCRNCWCELWFIPDEDKYWFYRAARRVLNRKWNRRWSHEQD